MREIIAVCRSGKRSRVRAAAVLDRYLWRIGDRTWRGKASNACLDRMCRELRASAKRNTAVAIHEIRSTHESRVPIVRIGSRTAFSPDGIAPVASHASRAASRRGRPARDAGPLAVLRIAVLFHDLGKATRLFQAKLRRSLGAGSKAEADAVRHELHSAVVWDLLVGSMCDADLIERLRTLEPQDIDDACTKAVRRLRDVHANPDGPLGLEFAEHEGTFAYAVGMLVLTHHRLPIGGPDHLELLATRHVNRDARLAAGDLEIAEGTPFWHDAKWIDRLRGAADALDPAMEPPGLDMTLRGAMMFADHLGSAHKEAREKAAPHLGNTTKEGRPADPLDLHIRRVLRFLPGCFDMLHRYRERYPALGEDAMPIDVLHPNDAPEPFAWQSVTARTAKGLCEAREGGFFGCLMAGTGTGKTRGAATLLAAAAFADARPERRYFRMTLALGLRSLAAQSAQEYVRDLRFDESDVAALIGRPPVRFEEGREEVNATGSESLTSLPRWLRVERAVGTVPTEGADDEADWLRRLSHDSGRGLPATLERVLEKDKTSGASARRLVSAPIVVGTIDHLMQVASPTRARFLLQAMRVSTADLVVDEIDQYEPEDIAAIGRLIYQAGAAGRRVIVMSATLPREVAVALHEAYRAGWSTYARASGVADHVNVLCSGDPSDSCRANPAGEAFAEVYDGCRDAALAALRDRPPRRRGRVLPPARDWNDLIDQVDDGCDRLHDSTRSTIEGVGVSVGFVRMTRIAHTAALAAQLPAGARHGRLRLKICLHSQFPRLHRSWLEREFKQALTRKGPDPDAPLRRWCERHGLLARARSAGCDQLEIVVVASPVIETGNDLDFDWAIIDPSSTRAVVQAAGRVWRHRNYTGAEPNVYILGRSPVVMAGGTLSRPGVETRPHNDTLVPGRSLEKHDAERRFSELAGEETFERIDAGAVLGDRRLPLHAEEAALRAAMVRADEHAPLGSYIRRPTTRLNLRMTRSRVFRRSVTRDVRYFQDQDETGDIRWYVDLAPGTRQSADQVAEQRGLTLSEDLEPNLAFGNLSALAWSAYGEVEGEGIGRAFSSMTEVLVPDYGRDSDTEVEPEMAYREWTGFTRGEPEDLFLPFGRNIGNQ